MSWLDHLGQAAAVLLLLELLVILLVVVGIAGGLGFGVHWVRGKAGWAFGKVNHFTDIGRGYASKGMGYVALPFVQAYKLAAVASGTAEALRAGVLARRRSSEVVAARPVPPLEEPTVQPMDLA